jgi:hypothetical protein
MSGMPPMTGAAANQTMTNGTGLAQNTAGQSQGWNDRSNSANNMSGKGTGMSMPAGAAASYPQNTGATSYSNSQNNMRMNTGTSSSMDRSYMTPTSSTGAATYPRTATTTSYPTGSPTAYPRSSTATSTDRMLSNPAVPSYPSSATGAALKGSSTQSTTTKPAAVGSDGMPAPASVSETSPSFGSSTSQPSAFTPQSGTVNTPAKGSSGSSYE